MTLLPEAGERSHVLDEYGETVGAIGNRHRQPHEDEYGQCDERTTTCHHIEESGNETGGKDTKMKQHRRKLAFDPEAGYL